MSIYTGSGDKGFASTANRRMIPKNAPVFALLGTLDELNSALGVARSRMDRGMGAVVEAIQQDVISLSGELAGGKKFADAARVSGMERSIDTMMDSAGQFQGFVTPGKSPAGAALDLARAVARRAEREMVAAKQTGGVTPECMRYLNRLSDLLYAMARLMDAQAPAAAQEPPEGEGFLDLAERLCRQVICRARAEGLRVVTAACDAGGNPAALLCDDGAYLASARIAQDKAYTSAALQMPTERLAELCKPGGELYGLQNSGDGRIVIFGGGVPLTAGGKLCGGFGVSGGSAGQDTGLANYALELFSANKREEFSR